MIARLATIAWLTLVWVLLWGSPSPANVIGGLVLAAVITWGFPVGRSAGAKVHPVAIARFGWWFLGALVVANLRVAREIVRPRLRLDQRTVTVPLRATSDLVTAFVANSISLTPGTLTVGVAPDPGPGDGTTVHVLEVHCLDATDDDAVRRECAAIEALVIAAFGTEADRLRIVNHPSAPEDGLR